MSWRDLISSVYESRGVDIKPRFYPSASAEEIADAEDCLNARLPTSIRSLLSETNGVMEMMAIDGGEWIESMWLLWSVAEIVKWNTFFRTSRDSTSGRDFKQITFFANAGVDGIQFGFPVMDGHVCAPRVVVWYPIGGEVEEVATSLEDFLNRWLTGAISV